MLCWSGFPRPLRQPSCRTASSSSKAQDPIESVLIAPVIIDGQVILPQGTLVRGQVVKAQPIEKPDTRAFLELEFSRLVDTAGKETKLEATVVGVDNAREKVEKGRITGILASETLSARIGQGVEKVQKKSSGLGGFLGAVKQAVLKEPDPEIVYEPGVEMTLELAKPVALDSSPL